MRTTRALPALVLLLGACGGGGSGEATATSSVPVTTPVAELDIGDLDFEGDPDSRFCQRSRAAAERPVEDPFVADLEPREVEVRFRALASRFGQFEDVAPPPLEEDLDLLVATFDRFARLLEEVDFDFSQLAQREVDRSVFDDPRLARVAARLEAYQEQVCADR